MARHGENIRKRKDGRWEARYIHSHTVEGKAVSQSDLSDPAVTDLTFVQVANMWLNARKDIIKTSSYNHYQNQLESHIFPDLVNYRFSTLTSSDVNTLLKNKVAQGYSPATVNGLRTILMMIFRYARNNRIICSVNDPVFIAKKRKNEVEAFTLNEQKILIDYLDSHAKQYNLSILISLYCGLRIGEVCALQWKDIQFSKETISVEKTLIRIQKKASEEKTKTEVVIQRPKTETSIRTIPVPDFFMPVLKTYKGKDEEYVITGTEHFMEPRVCLRKFKKIIIKLDISDYTFHAYHHTFATRCVELGMDAKTLSEILGHASVKTTLDRYVHPSIDLKKEQMNRLAKLIG